MANRATIHQLKVTLVGAKPPIWRRLLVPSAVEMHQLHVALQIAMGWQQAHPHRFDVNGKTVEEPDPEHYGPKGKRHAPTLRTIAPKEGSWMLYVYDFGDGWVHRIEVEKILPAQPGVVYPRCLTGRQACPPEDSGGIPGYAHLKEVLSNPADPEYQDLLETINGPFDPDRFDLAAVNAALAKMKLRVGR
jgi:hypothetical protein